MNNIDKTLEALLRKIFNTDDFVMYVFSHIKSDNIKEEEELEKEEEVSKKEL